MSRRARRAPIPAALAVVAVALAALVGLPLVSAPSAVADPGGDLQLDASPNKGLSATQAEITVTGKNFDENGELWVAVCQDDGVAPKSFAHCLGGAIPNANASSSWAVVSADGAPRYAGPVAGQFGKHGSFEVTLQIAVAAGQDADCIAGKCSVYTRSANPADRSQDDATSVRFTAPPPTPTRVSDMPTTQTIGAAPTTLAPDSIGEPTVAAGAEQSVIFSGFTPHETVNVTLFSDPIRLPSLFADSNGVVAISFTVPADLPPGEHLVQAVGSQSGQVGVAQFTVTDAVPTTTDVSPTDTSAVDSAESSMTESAAPTPSEAPSTASVPAATTGTTPAATAAAGPASESGGVGRLVWLWIAIAVLVVLGGAAAAVVMIRRRRSDSEGHGPGAPSSGPGGGPGNDGGPGGGAPGSGGPVGDRDGAAAPVPSWDYAPQPGGEWPLFTAGEAQPLSGTVGTYVGGPGAGPVSPSDDATVFLGQGGGVGAGAPAGGRLPDAGPSTEQWRPDFAAPAGEAQEGGVGAGASLPDAGPSTEQWRPDFAAPADGGDNPDVDPDDDPAGEPGSGGGRHSRA